MKVLKYICNKVITFAKHNIVIVGAVIFAFTLVVGGIMLGINGNGAAFTQGTGTLVILLALTVFLCFGLLAVNMDKVIRTIMCTGSLLILVEYISSVIYHINLNVYVSISWNDMGNICMFASLIRLFYIKEINPLFTKFFNKSK